MAVVLAIPDIHIPAEHPLALEHVKMVYDGLIKERDDVRVVFLGDIFDLHRASFHEQEPGMPSLIDEIHQCRDRIKDWIEVFPRATVTLGNHDIRIQRVAKKAGVPEGFLKSLHDIFDLPVEWELVTDVVIDGVRYSHGEDCRGGATGAYRSVTTHRQSQVYGHFHSFAGITWSATKQDLIFGFNVGCLVDNASLAMRYGRQFPNKPVLGCGVIYHGVNPIFIPVRLKDKIIRV